MDGGPFCFFCLLSVYYLSPFFFLLLCFSLLLYLGGCLLCLLAFVFLSLFYHLLQQRQLKDRRRQFVGARPVSFLCLLLSTPFTLCLLFCLRLSLSVSVSVSVSLCCLFCLFASLYISVCLLLSVSVSFSTVSFSTVSFCFSVSFSCVSPPQHFLFFFLRLARWGVCARSIRRIDSKGLGFRV